MSGILTRLVVIIVISAICIPLAFLGITHGSSFGLESGVMLIVVNVIAVIYMINLKKGSK